MKIRAHRPGSVLTTKFTPGRRKTFVAGLGWIYNTGESEGGLLQVTNDDDQSASIKGAHFLVESVGPDDPDSWSFADQGVEVGTVVCARPIAGRGQSSSNSQRELVTNEILLIGCGDDEESEWAMRPSPGNVLIGMDPSQLQVGLLYADPDTLRRIEMGAAVEWGTVLCLPRGYAGPLKVGYHVAMPFDRIAGAGDFIEISGGSMRCMAEIDLLGYEECAR